MRYLIIVLCCTLPTLTHALDFSAKTGKVYQACKLIAGKSTFTLNDDELFLAGQCLGSVVSVAHIMGSQCFDGIKGYGTYSADITRASNEALVQAFVNYAAKRPQDWDSLAAWTIGDALREYWPCP